MNPQDRDAITGLFTKLDQVGRQVTPDPEAQALIAESIRKQPTAPYLMAQTIVMQNVALEQAQERIATLEQQPKQSGGFLSSIFGGGQQNSPPPRQPQTSGPWANQPTRGGGGFLAGAAQTAVGVAGGVLLGNMIGGMFADDAAAAEPATAEPAPEEEPAFEDSSGDDDEI